MSSETFQKLQREMQTLVQTQAPRCELLAFFERVRDIPVNDVY